MKSTNTDSNLWTYHQTDNRRHLAAGHPRQDMLYRAITKRIKKGKVLEIGFGDGYLLRYLSKTYNCFGADIAKKNVEQMSETIRGVSFDIIDIDGKLPYNDNFFDCLVASEVLEHMSDDELKTNISELFRVLSPGGLAFITFPANENLKENECFCPNCSTVFHRWGHKQSFSSDRVDEIFHEFHIISKKIFFTPINNGTVVEKMISRLLCSVRSIMTHLISVPNESFFVVVKK